MHGKRRAWVVGAGDEPFPSVLRHVLRHLGFHLGAGLQRDPPPDLVLVAVERGHVALRLAVAREGARGAPVVAVLRASDSSLASHALAAGAHSVCTLDTSLAYLRDTVQVMLGLNAPPARADARPRRQRGLERPRPQLAVGASHGSLQCGL